MVAPAVNFGFAFDDTDFSDRVLRIELISELDSDEHGSKRKRKNLDTENVVKVITLNVSSPILAANSPFFYKLFKNGMKESKEREVTMRISASEEATLMDLLNFIYKNTLSATTAPDLLNVLMAADKYEVTSCMAHCSNLLKAMPVSLESTLLYLELPICEAVQPLRDAAKKYLVENFKDFTKSYGRILLTCQVMDAPILTPQILLEQESKEKAMKLPLFALEVVLGIDDLKVISEDHVFDFIVKWGRAHYPKVKARQNVLTKSLARFIHFPLMSSHSLEEVLASRDFIQSQMSKLVLQALHLNAGISYIHGVTNHGLIRNRIYENHPIKFVHVESPCPRYFVFLYLRKDAVKSLYPSKCLFSQRFLLGGRYFYLKVVCHNEHHQFGLYVRKETSSEACTLDFDFAVLMKNNLKEYQSKSKCKGNDYKLEAIGYGVEKLFGIPWTVFISDNSEYFINDVLHLRAELTIKNSQA